MSDSKSKGGGGRTLWDMIPGGHPIAKVLNIMVFMFAALYFIGSGLFGRTAEFTAQTVAVVGPDMQAAGGELARYVPGAPSIELRYEGQPVLSFGGLPPGDQYERLSQTVGGAFSGNGQPSSVFGQGSGATTGSSGSAQSVSQLVGNYESQVPADAAQREQQFLALVQRLISLVGGVFPVPDFSLVLPENVETTRQVLAAMKANAFDVVNPGRWEKAFEDAVRTGYAACFQARDLNCVEAWAPLQTRAVIDPPGLTEWLTALQTSDYQRFVRLAQLATNTNVADLAQRLAVQAYDQAKAARVATAVQNLTNGTATALDIQWAFAGRTVQVFVDEGLQFPSEMGGQRGKLSADDWVTFTANGTSYRVSGTLVMEAAGNITPGTQQAQFSDPPVLWTREQQERWTPGQPLP